jgi:cytochrome b subunit of formate dehydrogenase
MDEESFAFGSFRLIPGQRLLLEDGKPLRLGSRALDIYIGTLGMEGAFEAMGTGEVDFNWAKEHHDLWLEEKLAQGHLAASAEHPSATPAE